MTNYSDRLLAAIRAKRTAAVVGIDPVLERLPAELRTGDDDAAAAKALAGFAEQVVACVAPLVPAVKINSAFFEVYHDHGVAAYYQAVAAAHAQGLLVIGDVKRGDIGSTAKLYARGHLATAPTAVGEAGIPDAVTLAGYLGKNAIQPFVEIAAETGRGMYVLVRPSDPGADQVHEFGDTTQFYEHMADLVASWGQAPELIGQCGLSCVGAVVAPKDLESTAALRSRLAQTPFLVPGYGAQGGSAESCRPCFLPDGSGAVINASRSVIYAYEKAGLPEGEWRTAICQAAERFAADVAPLCGF